MSVLTDRYVFVNKFEQYIYVYACTHKPTPRSSTLLILYILALFALIVLLDDLTDECCSVPLHF